MTCVLGYGVMDAVHFAVQHLQHQITLFPKMHSNTFRRQNKLLCLGCMRLFTTAAIAKKVWNSVIKWVINPLSVAILIVLKNFKRRKILFFFGLFAYTLFSILSGYALQVLVCSKRRTVGFSLLSRSQATLVFN